MANDWRRITRKRTAANHTWNIRGRRRHRYRSTGIPSNPRTTGTAPSHGRTASIWNAASDFFGRGRRRQLSFRILATGWTSRYRSNIHRRRMSTFSTVTESITASCLTGVAVTLERVYVLSVLETRRTPSNFTRVWRENGDATTRRVSADYSVGVPRANARVTLQPMHARWHVRDTYDVFFERTVNERVIRARRFN